MKKFLVVGCFGVFLLFSCASTGSTSVSSVANISGYNYVSISDSIDSAETTEELNVGIKINEALLHTRLQIISGKEAQNLSEFEKEALLIVKFTVTSDFLNGSLVSINLFDYNSRRPVASCNGKDVFRYGEPGINKATDDAIKQLQQLF